MTDALIVHCIPGRIRLRIPAMRRDAAYFTSLEERLRETEAVHLVKTNPATASVTLQFTGDGKSLLDRLRELGLQPRLQTDTLRQQNTGIPSIRLTTGRSIDPMFMAGTVLAVVGLVQTFRGKIVVPSITAFWYALEAFRNSGRDR